MLRRILPIAFASCATLAVSIWVQDEPETQEPSLRYKLLVDGAEFMLEAGQPVQLAGEFRDPTLVLLPGESRQFAYAGLSFEYPASFVWEAEPDPNSINLWTMDGADLSIMIFESPYAFDANSFMSNLVDVFEGSEVEPMQMQLGDLTLSGYRLSGALLDEPIRYEALDIPTQEGARLLVFMDTTETPGAVSADYEHSLTMLKRSFAIVENQAQQSERIQVLQGKLADLEAQLESLRVTFNEDHELIRDVKVQIEAVRSQIAAQSEDF